MKTHLKVILAVLIGTGIMNAQSPTTEFKIGVLNPSGMESGLFFGVNSGRMIDEAMSWSISLDVFMDSYTEEMVIDTLAGGGGTPTITDNVTEIENSSFYLPVMVKLNYEKNLETGLVLRGGAGVGYALMWVNENNYRDDIEKTRFFSGFTYRFSAGLGIQISSSANLFIDAEYNGGDVSRDKGENSAGLPVRSEIDMSGLGLRIGVSIFNFGF